MIIVDTVIKRPLNNIPALSRIVADNYVCVKQSAIMDADKLSGVNLCRKFLIMMGKLPLNYAPRKMRLSAKNAPN